MNDKRGILVLIAVWHNEILVTIFRQYRVLIHDVLAAMDDGRAGFLRGEVLTLHVCFNLLVEFYQLLCAQIDVDWHLSLENKTGNVVADLLKPCPLNYFSWYFLREKHRLVVYITDLLIEW